MKKLFVLFAIIVTVGCQSLQFPKYEIGQTFRNVFVFDRDNTATPLPGGKWTLVGYNQRHALDKGRLTRVTLAQTDGNRLTKFIFVLLQSTQDSYGWEKGSKNCFGDKDENEEWILYSKIGANSSGASGRIDCWKIETWEMNKWNVPDWSPWNQSFDYYRKHSISTGKNAVIVGFVRSTPRKLLWVYYGFNPQMEGLTYSQNDNWQKHRYYQNKKRADYIEEKKEWAKRWELKVADGITGKLPVQFVQSVINRLANLQQLLDDEVISQSDYEKKKQEILDDL